MKVSELLLEANRNKIILVDFQPAYLNGEYGHDEALENTIESLNKMNPAEILVFFNGEDVGIEDTEHDVRYMFEKYGLDESLIQRMTMREKGYAWLRNWMDNDVPPAIIIAVVRYMVQNKVYDSRDIEPETMVEIIGQDKYTEYEDAIEGDMISIPDISIPELKSLSGALIGGGGKHECLKEITLLMNAFNIKYKLVKGWMYG